MNTKQIHLLLNTNLFLICFVATSAPIFGDDWPQWGGPRRDFTWNEPGLIASFPEGGPKILWRAEVSTGYSGPAVAAGKVYVMDYLLEEGDPRVDPGKRSELKGKERMICLDAASGKVLWEHAYDCPYNISYAVGPRCTPSVDEDRVYTLGAEGKLCCLNVADGKVIWERELKTDYKMSESPIWGFSAHPLVHGELLYCVVGGEGSIAVAFNKKNGKEVWRSMSATEPGYCPPIMINKNGVEQLVIWHSDAINGLDPASGKVLWSSPLKPSYAMSIAAPVIDGDFLFASGLGASALIQLDPSLASATSVWSGKGFNTSHSPIIADGGVAYGVDRTGWLRCIDLRTGERKWQVTEPVVGPRPANPGTGFLVKNGDRFLIAGETGELTIAKLTPEKYEKLSSVQLLEPTHESFGHKALWSCPAYSNGCMYWRNDKELICVSLKPD
jgi:outer membrane protein assembly factor BamB